MTTFNRIDDITHFLNALNVPFNKKWVKDMVDMATFHKLPNIINQLFDIMNINNLVVQLPIEKLSAIPLPAMALR